MEDFLGDRSYQNFSHLKADVARSTKTKARESIGDRGQKILVSVLFKPFLGAGRKAVQL